jgi:hypothetical protein
LKPKEEGTGGRLAHRAALPRSVHASRHAVYGEQKVSIGIEDRVVLEGTLPPRALRLALKWCRLHEAELLANWHRARRGEPLERVAPLE